MGGSISLECLKTADIFSKHEYENMEQMRGVGRKEWWGKEKGERDMMEESEGERNGGGQRRKDG